MAQMSARAVLHCQNCITTMVKWLACEYMLLEGSRVTIVVLPLSWYNIGNVEQDELVWTQGIDAN
jgi:hypothetical protein